MTANEELNRRFPNRFDDLEVFLARNSENAIYTFVFEGGDEKR